MENNLYKAYAEVDQILSFMDTKYVEKVPLKMRQMFKNEKLKDYEPHIDRGTPLDKQNLQKKTLAILVLLNINYWCDSIEEKQELLKLYSENDKKREEQLREKYNPDNIFNKNDNRKNNEEVINKVTDLVIYKKENIIKKILNKIKKLFKK